MGHRRCCLRPVSEFCMKQQAVWNVTCNKTSGFRRDIYSEIHQDDYDCRSFGTCEGLAEKFHCFPKKMVMVGRCFVGSMWGMLCLRKDKLCKIKNVIWSCNITFWVGAASLLWSLMCLPVMKRLIYQAVTNLCWFMNSWWWVFPLTLTLLQSLMSLF